MNQDVDAYEPLAHIRSSLDAVLVARAIYWEMTEMVQELALLSPWVRQARAERQSSKRCRQQLRIHDHQQN